MVTDREVVTIDRAELVSKLEHGEPFRLIMALNEWAFDAKHIPGSEHFNTRQDLYSSVDPSQEVIVYCTNVDCHASIALYHELVDRGFQRVRRYAGGLADWESAGLSLEGNWAQSEHLSDSG